MQGLCNPNHTAGEDQDICEDLFTTLCNPDDILPADYEFCDWVGFTADVDWSDYVDDELLYAKYVSISSGSSSADHKSPTHDAKHSFKESMCAPESIKPHNEDLCEDIWVVMCAPDVEMEIDDGFCDWVGFTADIEWYYSEDEYDEYYDWGARRNLRGHVSN